MFLNVRSDLDNLNKLYNINRICNSPKIIRNFPSRDKKAPKTIVLEKSTPFDFFPTYVEVLKKDKYNIRTPNRNLYTAPYNDKYKNLSFQYSTDRDNYTRIPKSHNYSSDNAILKNSRNRKIRKDNMNYTLATPEQISRRNGINKPLTMSPNNYSSYDNTPRGGEIDVQIGGDYLLIDKHKMRYLLSKENKKSKRNKKKKKTLNNIKTQNNFYQTYNTYFPKKNSRTCQRSFDGKYGNKNIEKSRSYAGDYNQNRKRKRPKTIGNITPYDTYNEEQYNVIQDYIPMNNINNSYSVYYNDLEINLDDLILIEMKFNDIYNILNNTQNVFNVNSTNECFEFFAFYFSSSLKNKFSLFFADQNYIIVQTAFNLLLFMVIITYHLSLNPPMLLTNIMILRNIFDKLRINLYVIIKKIQLYYGDAFCSKNEGYFNKYNYFLINNGLFEINEREIIDIISGNSVFIVNQLSKILNYYKEINDRFFLDFENIYLSLSKLNEQDLNSYFYNNLLNFPEEYLNTDYLIENTIETDNNCSDINNNFCENYMEDEEENEQYLENIILDYKKNKQIAPFITTKSKKKYTLVLDLGGTLIDVKLDKDGNALCRWRPGILAFLGSIKPYYEIIAFTKLSRDISSIIIGQIEKYRHFFDYNFCRDNCVLVNNKFVKDISRIGRDMKKTILVDDVPSNLEYHIENGILICPYDADSDGNDEESEDRVLYELKKILLIFYKLGYEDLRLAIKEHRNEIYNKITLGYRD